MSLMLNVPSFRVTNPKKHSYKLKKNIKGERFSNAIQSQKNSDFFHFFDYDRKCSNPKPEPGPFRSFELNGCCCVIFFLFTLLFSTFLFLMPLILHWCVFQIVLHVLKFSVHSPEIELSKFFFYFIVFYICFRLGFFFIRISMFYYMLLCTVDVV